MKWRRNRRPASHNSWSAIPLGGYAPFSFRDPLVSQVLHCPFSSTHLAWVVRERGVKALSLLAVTAAGVDG